MKQSITIIAIILGTFLVAFSTSLLLELQLVTAHWLRELLIIIFIVLQLVVGFLLLRNYAKTLIKKS